MAQITIYQDYSGLVAEEEAELHLTQIADYVPVYRAIARALQRGETLTVAIERQARVCEAWLRRMAEQRGQASFEFVPVTPRSRLASLWGVEIPKWVSDQAIRNAGLLNKPVSAKPGETFEDIIARCFYSPHLAHNRLPLSHLVDLLADLDDRRRDARRGRQLLGSVYRRRMNRWMEVARNDGERLLVRLLRDNPDELRSLLARFKLLSGYPDEVGLRAMGDDFKHLKPLNFDLAGLSLDEEEVQTSVDQIKVYLNQVRRQEASADLAEELLEQVSGELEVEFDLLHELVTEWGISVDRPLLRRIWNRFAPMEARIADKMRELELRISPKRPEKPDSEGDWKVTGWIEWAVNQYLPYRFWLEETEQRDEEIEGYAEAYADWLYERFSYLRSNLPCIVYRALHNQIEYLEGEGPVLFVAVDNFNYKFLKHLERLMEKAGLYRVHSAPYLSMLPACTEVSKKCLFTGSPEPFKGTAYKKPIQDAWASHLGGRRLRYLPYLGSLKEIREREHDVYFLNHTLIDDTLHQDEKELGISHAKAVRRRIADLVEAVKEFARRIEAEHDLVVITCSDHGSTRIPAETPNFIDQEFYADRVDDPHHRYVSISDEEMKALPDHVDFQCYRLRRKAFGLNKNYLVARDYYRFRETEETFYVHGGLTPEETIVPLCIFQPVVEKPKPLTVRLLQDEFRYGAKSMIRLELVNVNPYPCVHVRVEVLDSNVECEPAELDELAAQDPEEVHIPARLWRSEKEMTRLHIQISYQCLGERRRQVVEPLITIRSMMETGFDLEELDGTL